MPFLYYSICSHNKSQYVCYWMRRERWPSLWKTILHHRRSILGLHCMIIKIHPWGVSVRMPMYLGSNIILLIQVLHAPVNTHFQLNPGCNLIRNVMTYIDIQNTNWQVYSDTNFNVTFTSNDTHIQLFIFW